MDSGSQKELRLDAITWCRNNFFFLGEWEGDILSFSFDFFRLFLLGIPEIPTCIMPVICWSSSRGTMHAKC